MAEEERLIESIELMRDALSTRRTAHWIIGYSGGKDSSALLKIACAALRRTPEFSGRVSVVYCDTGVESPVLDAYVHSFFVAAEAEFREKGLPIDLHVVRAPIGKRFFVKIIGRGYPPPTNAFRWCAKDLRISPVADFITSLARDQDIVVAIGSRKEESEQRRRSIKRHGSQHWQVQREAKQKYDLFLPLLDLNVETVWDAVFSLGTPDCLDASSLERLYRGASGGECPVIKGPTANPCAKGRFGCWTCTVVRKDRSAEGLIREGFLELKPFLDFRNWLAEFRNDLTARWPVRRSGRSAPGPFTLSARLIILLKVRALEESAKRAILSSEELTHISELLIADVAKEREVFGRATAAQRRILAAIS